MPRQPRFVGDASLSGRTPAPTPDKPSAAAVHPRTAQTGLCPSSKGNHA